MGTILNGKYLSMPEQVQKNKNDIEIINQYLQNVYKTSSTLTQDTTSINIEDTDIDINNLNFALLIDRQGHIYKIVDVIGEVVYLNFLTNILGGTEYNFTGEWVSDNNEYYVNDLVLYNGNLYLCEANIVDSSIPPNQDITHWSLFVGYGNDISEFVKGEYEKGLNLFGRAGETIVINSGNNQWIEYWNLGDLYGLVEGETYTISSFDIPNGIVCQFLGEYRNFTNSSYTFVYNNQGFRIGGDVVENTQSFDLKIQIEKGSTVTLYQPYNGELIREVDITPVTLWENASPNSQFGTETLYYDLTPYKRVRGVFMGWIGTLIHYTIEVEVGKSGLVISNPSLWGSNFSVDTREISITENSISIYENKRYTQGNNDSVIENGNNIPIAFYGLKY